MRVIGLLLVVACSGSDDDTLPTVPDEGTGLLGTGWANPFPNAEAIGADGSLSLRDLPSGGDTPLPLDRLAWRTGFSPAQTSVLRLPGVRADGLPTFASIDPNAGTVRMVDLTDGRALACFAELDAHPDAADEPALLIRPLEALPYGHRIGVVVTTDAVERPERFDALLSDRPPASLADRSSHYRELLADLSAVTGVAQDDIAVAWDFPIADGTRPLTSALEQLAPPSAPLTITRLRELDAGDGVAPYTWRAVDATFRVQDFLIDDLHLDLQADASVRPVGETDAYLYVHLPTSVKDAPAGSVPVLVFGHGIFGQPSFYLDDADDPSSVLQLADEAGMVVVATNWRGLTYTDRTTPIAVATDFGRFPDLTDQLVQGQINTRTLVEQIAAGAWNDDPIFTGAQGQSLLDTSRIYYYGISLGAIEGAVMLAQDPPIDAAALHVGGAMWSTMLERSSNWSAFELLVVPTIPDPADRQVLYALSQLWWDPVDPIAWVGPLSQRSLLLQESVGDEQVPNLTTDALARSLGLPILTPAPGEPWGLEPAAAPLGPGSRALVRFDPDVGLPEAGNRPAAVTEAHEIPRTWTGARRQVIDHLQPGLEGQVIHHCGAGPCTAANTGD